jgi:hypothetical protein
MAADPLDPKALGGGDKMAPVRSDGSDPSGKFACRMCGKGFGLQRLLNRHMKCHSDTKVLLKKLPINCTRDGILGHQFYKGLESFAPLITLPSPKKTILYSDFKNTYKKTAKQE